jgi:nucleoside 2-deoxyribosyltransferase
MPEDKKTAFTHWEGYSRAVEKALLPELESSDVAIIVYGGKTDVKQATEVGYAVLMGKPLVVIAEADVAIPDGLSEAADTIILGSIDVPEVRLTLASTVDQLLRKIEEAGQ